MQANADDRLAATEPAERPNKSVLIWVASAAFVATIASAICVASFGFRQTVAAISAQFNPITSDDAKRFADLYKRWGTAPLTEQELSIDRVLSGMRNLSETPCDKRAIYDVGEGLYENKRTRTAAIVYRGFADTCVNDEGDRRRAAQLYLEIGDYESALSQTNKLVEQDPTDHTYYYLRAQARVGLKQHEDALSDYANTIQFESEPVTLGSWVFEEMAAIYATLGRFCEAVTPIETYVAMKPSERANQRTQTLVERYSASGRCASFAQGSERVARGTNGVIEVRADINGVPGKFILDTGASFVSVSADFANRASIRGAQDRIISNTANGAISTALGTAQSIRVGRAEATEVAVVLLPKPIGTGIDGLLGMSFIARFDLKIGQKEWQIAAKKQVSSSETSTETKTDEPAKRDAQRFTQTYLDTRPYGKANEPLEKWFSSSYANLLTRGSALNEPDGEWDPIFIWQDCEDCSLTQPATSMRNTTHAAVMYTVVSKLFAPYKIRIALVNESGKWKIDDVVHDDPLNSMKSQREALRRSVEKSETERKSRPLATGTQLRIGDAPAISKMKSPVDRALGAQETNQSQKSSDPRPASRSEWR